MVCRNTDFASHLRSLGPEIQIQGFKNHFHQRSALVMRPLGTTEPTNQSLLAPKLVTAYKTHQPSYFRQDRTLPQGLLGSPVPTACQLAADTHLHSLRALYAKGACALGARAGSGD